MQSSGKLPETYTPEDVQEILQRAIARQAEQNKTSEFSRAELLEMAEDLGISPADLQVAEKAWLAQQATDKEKQVFDTFRYRDLKRSGVRYAIVNTFLVGFNVAIAHSLSWSLYILLGWGLLLALKAWRTYDLDGEEYEKAFQKWQLKQQFGQSLRTIGQSINTAVDRFLKS